MSTTTASTQVASSGKVMDKINSWFVLMKQPPALCSIVVLGRSLV